MPPPRRLDHETLATLLKEVWPDVLLRELSVQLIARGRNAEHYRVHHRDRSLILRSSSRDDEGVQCVVGALTALADEPFAPQFYRQTDTSGRGHLIAMEDVGARPLTAIEIEQRAPDLIEIVRRVHEHEAFQEAVAGAGRDDLHQDEPPDWFNTSIERVRELAPGDERLAKLERWLESARSAASTTDLINSVLVHGHGDLHRDNWLLNSSGPMLVDWEDVGLVPLANELASLIVFGHLSPRSVAELYGVAPDYVEAVERSTALHALYLYAHWLQRLLEEESVDPYDLAYAEAVCERAFG